MESERILKRDGIRLVRKRLKELLDRLLPPGRKNGLAGPHLPSGKSTRLSMTGPSICYRQRDRDGVSRPCCSWDEEWNRREKVWMR